MYRKAFQLLNSWLEDGIPEKSLVEELVSKALGGRQVTCYPAENVMKIRIHVPTALRSSVQKHLNSKEIGKQLNAVDTHKKYQYQCEDIIGGVSIRIVDSPSNINNIQILI